MHLYLTSLRKVEVESFSCVRLFATPWTVAYQAPPSVGFSRQEYLSGLPFPSIFSLLLHPHSKIVCLGYYFCIVQVLSVCVSFVLLKKKKIKLVLSKIFTDTLTFHLLLPPVFISHYYQEYTLSSTFTKMSLCNTFSNSCMHENSISLHLNESLYTF